ncbi:hypothetical protein BYT27DRAFT_7112687 [Phlegmacium glaucopus]|nr:hypothetical protein BYT27DRAFT_7112687 [Phlegmacium glaucopus]
MPTFNTKTSEFCSNLPDCSPSSVVVGGGRAYLFSHLSIAPFIKRSNDELSSVHVFQYVDHVDNVGCLSYPVEHGFVYADLSLTDIIPHISKHMIQKIANIHKISLGSSWHLPKAQLVEAFSKHNCINCSLYISVLKTQLSPSLKKKESSANAFTNLTKEERVKRNQKKKIAHNLNRTNLNVDIDSVFPPPALTKELSETIIRDWCKATNPSVLEEAGCAVCGELVPVKQLSRLKAIKKMLNILAAPGVTRIEHKLSTQSITEFKGPVLDYQCDKICDDC